MPIADLTPHGAAAPIGSPALCLNVDEARLRGSARRVMIGNLRRSRVAHYGTQMRMTGRDIRDSGRIEWRSLIAPDNM